MAKKELYFEKWKYREWKADHQLGSCALETRGVWIEWLSSMMEAEVYSLTGTLTDLAVAARTTSVAKVVAAIKDLHDHGAADFLFPRNSNENVTQNITALSRSFNGEITVINRKRERELKPKELNRLRQERFRNKSKNNADVTPLSNSKSHCNSKELQSDTPGGGEGGRRDDFAPPKGKGEILHPRDGASLGYAVAQYFNIFPTAEITILQGAQIAKHVKDTPDDRKAWTKTLAKYESNYNPAKKSYLPEKIGNVLSVFADELERVKNNGSNQKHNTGNRATSTERIAATIDSIQSEFPSEAELGRIG